MLVKQLISILQKFEQDKEIKISIDEEGNDFKSIDEVAYDGECDYVIWPYG